MLASFVVMSRRRLYVTARTSKSHQFSGLPDRPSSVRSASLLAAPGKRMTSSFVPHLAATFDTLSLLKRRSQRTWLLL